MRVVFMGTPDFAVPCLEALLSAGHTVPGVITQPDKPVGRKQIMTPPAVKTCAAEHGITVYQPVSMRDGSALEIISALAPDVIVVAAYGKILPKEILDYPRYGCINVHGSLLPAYRGAAPIQWAVINGESETGVTIMQMNEGLDTGDILYTRTLPIDIDDTAESVFDKLSVLGAQALVEALDLLEKGKLNDPVKQDDCLSSYAPMLDKSMSVIDWNKPAKKVHDLIRGLYSWPIAETTLNGKRLKIYRSSLGKGSGKPGSVISLDPFTVACCDGAVIIHELQLEGKKRMDASSFLIGHKTEIGTVLGG